MGPRLPSLQLLHVSLSLQRVGVTLTPVGRIFYRVHRLQSLLLSLGVDHFDDEVYHVYRQGEAQHREEELYPSMSHFNTLVVDLASLHIAGPQWVPGVEALSESCVVVRFTARSVDQPPAETPGSEAEKILAGGEVTNLQVITDDEHIEANPEEGPQHVGYQIAEPQLEQTEEAEYDEDDVEKVCQYWEPHIAHEVKDLSLRSGDQLDEEDHIENVPWHAVLGHLDLSVSLQCCSGSLNSFSLTEKV